MIPTPMDFPENQLGASLKATRGTTRRCPRCDFPENQLGASLKDPELRSAAQDPVYFPENQLGASLKVDALAPSLVAAITSPRTNSGPH